MKHIVTRYEGKEKLQHFLDQHHIDDSRQLLVQIFTSQNSEPFIRKMLDTIQKYLPSASIIGATTDGEIINGNVVTHQTVLSFTLFEDTQLACTYSLEEDSFKRGQSLAGQLIDDRTRLLIVFTDGLHTNGEFFLEGINSVSSRTVVAGGMAGDYAKFEKTYVFTKQQILSNGAVGVALKSDRLQLFNDYCFNWQKIGKPLRITRCKENRVYEIDGKRAVETYTHYLGKEIADLLPSVGIEFPLIGERNGMEVARAVISRHDDGSLSFAGNMHQGEEVHFGYGDLQKILEDSDKIPGKMVQFQAEAIFVYSCMARRNFIGNAISQELEPFQNIAPTSGFFTYGEFFYKEKNELLNQTMTVLALRESALQPERKKMPHETVSDTPYHSVNALIHLLNVTSREVMEQKVFYKSYEQFAQLFEYSGDGLAVLKEMKIIECNAKTLSLFGYSSSEKKDFLQKPLKDFVLSLSKIEGVIEKMKHTGTDNLLFDMECRNKTGHVFWIEIMLTRVVNDGESYYYMVLRDISDRKILEEKLRHQHDQLYLQAYRDDLTGLANRKSFMETLEKEIASARKKGDSLALLFIDLDKLKVVNDSLGHPAGDKLIQLVSKRISRVTNSSDIVARLGGDEFLILLKDANEEQIRIHAEKFLRITREEIIFDRNHLFTSASIGVAQFPKDAKDANNLLKYADTAMYEAKERGGNQYYFYSSELTQKAYAQIKIAKEFRRGIKRKEFMVYYQPQIDMNTGKIIGLEALIRWNHPQDGFLSPAQFLPALEKANLLKRMDRWVMYQSMKEMVYWYRHGLNPGKLSLNIGMSELESGDWEDKLLKTMNRIGFNPEWLEIEITETEVMKQPKRVISLIQNLHAHGITIAIDDFGTGYSSLAQIKHLPFDTLKIDKLFIDDLPHGKDACVLFDIMMTLANNIGASVLAEGMESQEQVDYLKQTGCQYAQGYYYAKPMDAAATTHFLEQARAVF